MLCLVADSNVPPVKPTVSTDNKIPTTIVHPPPVMQSHSIAHVDTLTPIVPPPPDIQPMVDSVAKYATIHLLLRNYQILGDRFACKLNSI